MATLEKLVPGQRLWERRRQRMGNTTMRGTCIFDFVVKEVNADEDWVLASWNGNPPQKYHRDSVKKWLVNDPRAAKKPKLSDS